MFLKFYVTNRKALPILELPFVTSRQHVERFPETSLNHLQDFCKDFIHRVIITYSTLDRKIYVVQFAKVLNYNSHKFTFFAKR